jgi:hypothetical protein
MDIFSQGLRKNHGDLRAHNIFESQIMLKKIDRELDSSPKRLRSIIQHSSDIKLNHTPLSKWQPINLGSS